MIPGVKGPPPTKQEARDFHEWDANCNTCHHLQRVPCSPTCGGPHDGVCKLTNTAITFHPDDWMGMPCWQSRPRSILRSSAAVVTPGFEPGDAGSNPASSTPTKEQS